MFIVVINKHMKTPKNLCVQPWTHLHLHTNGNVMPCCLLDTSKVDANSYKSLVSEDTLLKALNSDGFKAIRKAFLNNEKPDICSLCFNREEAGIKSGRIIGNEKYLDAAKDEILATNDDGSIDNFVCRSTDLRFSNICNLRCRTCSLAYSSSWFDETVKLDPNNKIEKFIRANVYNKLDGFLDSVDYMYWAGGEPLLESQHFKVLNDLISNGTAKNISLAYNTNLTTVTYKKNHISEWWNHFKNVNISASIDAIGNEGEYIRTDSKWNIIKQNFNDLKFNYKNLSITPSVTLSILNFHNYPKFIKWCVDNDWIDNNTPLHLNILTNPDVFSLKYLPISEKEKFEESLLICFNEISEEYHSETQLLETIQQNFDQCIQLVMHNDHNVVWDEHKARIIDYLDSYDRTGNLSWRKSLPELSTLLNT